MAFINFKLKHPDDISPFGEEPNTTLHWFGLTDSEYWLSLGELSLYEYSTNFLLRSGVEGTNHADYYLSRLVEDLMELFPAIGEPAPEPLYEIAKNGSSLSEFQEKAASWMEEQGDDETMGSNASVANFEAATKWISDRTLYSGHLFGGPGIGFFRQGNKISIVWKSDAVYEEKAPIWTAQNGQMEMAFENFFSEMEDFGDRFFSAMEQQVDLAVAKDWAPITLDKAGLLREKEERKNDYYTQLQLLKRSELKTAWGPVLKAVDEIQK